MSGVTGIKRYTGFLAALLWLAAAPVLAQEVTEPITIGDETYFGVRTIPGFSITGKYLYESKGEPSVTLNADGSGAFARHGRPPQPVTWWIMADADGKAKTLKGEIGQQHTLIFQDAAGKFDMNMMTIRTDMRQIIILGERFKAY